MIEEIENYINGEDYPDEIPKRIMGLFERRHADLLAEVKRLREENIALLKHIGYPVKHLEVNKND
jgi:hypothetical protein